MIKVIIFDLGGVVLEHSYEDTTRLLAKGFNVKHEEVNDLFNRLKADWSVGKIDIKFVANYFSSLSKKPSTNTKIIKSWIEEHRLRAKLNKKVLKLIDSLRKKYKVVLLTNTIDLHFEAVLKTGLLKHFDQSFASYKLGLRKPDKKIYNHVLNIMKVKPTEAIFIDDNKDYTQAAQTLGISSITFTNYENLKTNLEKLGLL